VVERYGDPGTPVPVTAGCDTPVQLVEPWMYPPALVTVVPAATLTPSDLYSCWAPSR
jgi:hypothetical protein